MFLKKIYQPILCAIKMLFFKPLNLLLETLALRLLWSKTSFF